MISASSCVGWSRARTRAGSRTTGGAADEGGVSSAGVGPAVGATDAGSAIGATRSGSVLGVAASADSAAAPGATGSRRGRETGRVRSRRATVSGSGAAAMLA